ncbi:Planctomycete cytochrome C [Novipirellula galeiformis]|uniref:Planctomycete cytochrome C n=1 Tax=Novipirellula galeiformis TaxID=2528004 RepID=A0A5C6CFY7_9BACT|nr:DUF1553 domain-containing protein [Novipirellula galeiformis]TWU21619.1 Planctomycete cytochrome C [Novipirellula galeiformis]
MHRISLALFAGFLFCGQAVCQQLSREERNLFEIHVRPTLTQHCIKCHGETKQEGGLQLTTLEQLLEGGESGPAIVVGNPDESLLVEALRYESFEMPPEEPLQDEPIAGLVKWIAAGAPWPADVTIEPPPTISEQDREWWCYQPIRDPKPPATVRDDWCRGDLDRFILTRLESENLAPSFEADPLTLVRRVHFAITGLPPDEAAIKAASSADFDYQAMVDRLLQSEAYGESQARHWLDLVRYADSDGYRADHVRPHAHLYRDYVIRSFNEDKSYDRFIREQLAGDEIDPGNRDAHIATMYLRHWIYEHNQRDVETQWHEILNDITETTSDVFLAQGLKCARCHDHKFDPLLQKDFFRIKAFFAAFQPTEGHPVADAETRRVYQAEYAKWEAATSEIRERLREIEYPVAIQHATREKADKFIAEIKAMIHKQPHERTPYEHQIASLAERQFDLPYDKLSKWLSEEQEQERQALHKKLAEFDAIKPEPLPAIDFVASDVGPVAPETFIPDASDKTPIAPGFITLLDDGDAEITSPPASLRSTGRRTALADWIASPENPLTARVIVNRVWQQHFGVGLVETSSDFGQLGVPPTHPLLLDWLASRFIEDGWSLKKLHRRILLSATYRQTSQRPIDEALSAADPHNELLWRMNPRRLSGEEITDAVLTASGELNSAKRAIYKTVRRNSPDPLLAAFDAPDRMRSVGKRHRTTTSPQALLLSNGSWSHDRATAIVRRIANRGDDELLIANAYEALFSRQPSQDEVQMALEFLEHYAGETPEDPGPKIETLVSMPKVAGHAIDLKPGGPMRVSLATSKELPDGDFTVEAVVLLRSLYENANVRTIVGHWNGNRTGAGWSLGVTSAKSSYKPRNLILQLVGKTATGEALHYEVVASNLRPELNKPYYVAASVKLDDTSENGITFYLKDLSVKDAKLQVAHAKHTVTKGIRPNNDLTIGDRFGQHQWDGLIDSIRIEAKARDLTKVAQADSAEGLPNYVTDWQFEDKESIGFDSSGHQHHASTSINESDVASPRTRARIALVHALLNSNEFIYID